MDMPDSGMGHFHVSVQVSHRAGGRFEPLEALVDTGATYTWIPRDVLEGLGIVPEDQWPFVLADGREVLYPVAWARPRPADDRRIRRTGLRADPWRGHARRVPPRCRSGESAAHLRSQAAQGRYGRPALTPSLLPLPAPCSNFLTS